MMFTLLLLAFFFGRAPGSPTCPAMHDKQIKLCIGPTIQAAEQIGVQLRHAPAAIPRMGKQVFLELCGHLEKMETCLESRRLRDVCPGHPSIRVMDSSYGYLCNDGRNAFLAQSDCLLQLDTNPRTESCHSDAMLRINRIHQAPESDRRQRDMCDALDSFASCVRDSVLDNCGADAWSLILRVLVDTTQTLMPNCRLGPHDPPPTPVSVFRQDVVSYNRDSPIGEPSMQKGAASLTVSVVVSLVTSGIFFVVQLV